MSRRTLIHDLTAALVLLSFVLIPTAGQAASSVGWQIGKFDEASFEFREGLPASDPVFTVGKSDPAQDWYGDQPGTANGMAGFREHPFTIKFELPQAPKGLYTLKLSRSEEHTSELQSRQY